ncbi:MAG: guanosine 3,5-bis-pyrophosphate (ppGpp) synthetase [Gammaproteobacteria bacterium]|nr:guanosine 3,5-bis-pyrophosphate (ppGpp) synthetase [Gammaproteobacteria bacterium]MDG1248475.1 bifunctional (p)ppGpp synthetase/guanosine-3',5'-bis(diphosphate) 3'-pyrophosphohydrolase [SAR86 cluster bacterium]MDG2092162.1 bifunctional (p)ppGpp synthetase/guanosine-3',5'-bis(diphosphate) 3'-pyrophosphohydrolase [SAR86 cluster bacterium]
MTEQALPKKSLTNFTDDDLLSVPSYLLAPIKAYLKSAEIKKIQRAYTFAFIAHDGQKRKDGSAYISHPVAVAKIVAELKMDHDSICAALMHDVLEDCDVQKTVLENNFGKDVANIVDGVSKLGKIHMQNKAETNANNFQKMALAMANDVRVILVKLCDRLHNMRTIDFMPRHKQIIKSKETLEMFAPLALRVGMIDIKNELEDRAFRCLHPLRAEMLDSAIQKSSGGRKKIIEKVRKELKANLKNNGIDTAAVKGREKNAFSIYNKIKTKHKPFSEILDVYGFRILVDTVDECYRALGIIHNYYSPIDNRFKDYIAIPKMNGYQALHTGLLALDAFPIEVQIQTRSMFDTANRGIAAHWGYKTSQESSGTELRATKWLTGLLDLYKESKDSSEFVESIKTDLEPERVFVFSPKGHIFGLKIGATPIDFAYAIHRDLGDTIVGCKVNRKEAPINVELESGQTVEIITSKNNVVIDPAWLNFIVTSRARSGIRARLRNQKVSSARKAGKIMLETELKRSGIKLSDYKGATLKRVLGSIGVPSLTKLMTDLGLGKKTGNIVAQKFYEGLQIRKNSGDQQISPLRLANKKIEGVSVVFAKCCRPILDDEIIAHSDTERGIVIHHKICQQVVPFLAKDTRYQPALWDAETKKHLYIAKLKVISENKVGVLSDVLSIFTREGINVVFVNTNAIDATFANIELEIEINDTKHLNILIDKVNAKKFVSDCSRQINEG